MYVQYVCIYVCMYVRIQTYVSTHNTHTCIGIHIKSHVLTGYGIVDCKKYMQKQTMIMFLANDFEMIYPTELTDYIQYGNLKKQSPF